ncbi:MAG: transposase [Candidatus Cloacimonetes bacterium]|nr:transposase [Candidatus Cloacimonadota bacterium]
MANWELGMGNWERRHLVGIFHTKQAGCLRSLWCGCVPCGVFLTEAGVPAGGFVEESKGWHSRGYLPHFDAGNIYQFITFRLYDSVPKEVIQKWKDELGVCKSTDINSKEYIELHNRIQKYEDNGYGQCFLKDDKINKVVEEALNFYHKIKYDLIEYAIMPNHVHVLIKVYEGNNLSSIVHSWKSFTALAANRILNRKGNFWMKDYYDRYIRNDEHFQAAISYIKKNSIK